MKVGVLSDSHIPASTRRLPEQVFHAFEGVDLVLHAGDIYVASALDELESLAPVLAVGEHIDLAIGPPRVEVRRVLELDGARIGMVHILSLPGVPGEIFPGRIAGQLDAPPSVPDALAVLLKPAGSRGDVVTLQAWPYAGAPQLDASYWSAGSQQASAALVAELDHARQPEAPHVALAAAATYDDGRWSLVIQRPLELSALPGAATIALNDFTAVAFAVWDGGNADARAVSPWIDLVLEQRTPHR